MSYPRTCDYCGRSYEAKRPHARWCSDECSTQGWIYEDVYGPLNAFSAASAHPLADVRAEQEQVAEKARWTLIVREHMARTLLETGYFHSDDLEPLGIPEQHCNIAGSQSGGFVSRGLMVEVGRRASSKPSRKKAKSAIYRITIKGRTELSGTLVGSDAGVTLGGSTSVRSGENQTDASSQNPRGLGGSVPSPAETGVGSPEPLSLLPETALERMEDAA